MNGLKLLIVDSSIVYRKMFTRAATELDENVLIVSVSNSVEAINAMHRKDFDVIIIDVETSVMDSAAFFKETAMFIPKALTLVTAQPSSVSERLCADALANGAFDYMIKPIKDSYEKNLEVVSNKLFEVFNKIYEERGNKVKNAETIPVSAKKAIPLHESDFHPELVLIASSTGGPLALEGILSGLKPDFPVPVLIVQHMPVHFMENLAMHLNKKSGLNVKIAENGETVTAGTVYIAPGGLHMKLDSKNKVALDESPPVNGIRPAADVLFRSVAESFKGSGILAIVLTGMGADGEKGIKELKKKQNCFTIVQSEQTCVVYGMPRMVEESGLADMILDLDQIPPEIENMLKEGYGK